MRKDLDNIERAVVTNYGRACPIGDPKAEDFGLVTIRAPETFGYTSYCEYAKSNFPYGGGTVWPETLSMTSCKENSSQIAHDLQRFDTWRQSFRSRQAIDVFSLGRTLQWFIYGDGNKKPKEQVSDAMHDFVYHCTQFDPQKRPTLESLLKHPFIVENNKSLKDTPNTDPNTLVNNKNTANTGTNTQNTDKTATADI